MTFNELFEDTGRVDTSLEEQRINIASHRLAVMFAEDDKLPSRYRKNTAKRHKKRNRTRAKKDSDIDKRFKSNVKAWKMLISKMLKKIDQEQAWRFINLSPKMDGYFTRLVDNQDFIDFMDYLILRRDTEKCDHMELGGLAQLSTAFQRQIEKKLEKKQTEEQSERIDGEGLGSAGTSPSPSS